jgi:hypothetical protein
LTWIYDTISNDLQQSMMLRQFSARGAWCYLKDEFLSQKESCALLLETQFRNFCQGSLDITDNCRRLESMATSLTEFGDPIGDRQMVLTLLCGLVSPHGVHPQDALPIPDLYGGPNTPSIGGNGDRGPVALTTLCSHRHSARCRRRPGLQHLCAQGRPHLPLRDLLVHHLRPILVVVASATTAVAVVVVAVAPRHLLVAPP